MVRVGFLGPEGTFTQQAVMAAGGHQAFALVPLPTIREVIQRVQNGHVDYGVVPIENSIEGSVNVTLDALALDADNVLIVGESVQPIEQCLIAREPLALESIELVLSHPQGSAQCARFLRGSLPQARIAAANSTADAVRQVSRSNERWAAIGNRLAAEHYGCTVLREAVEDEPGNETRFVWLGPQGAEPGIPGESPPPAAWKTALVFWGSGSGSPGWLVDCLSELSSRGVNMTRIESRPRKRGLGEYIFFVDCDGNAGGSVLTDALQGLRRHVEVLRVLGSFPAG